MAQPYSRPEHPERLSRPVHPLNRGPHLSSPVFQTRLAHPHVRLIRSAAQVFPVYAALTLALWLILLLLGDPALADPAVRRAAFFAMRELFDALRTRFPQMDTLSMGMSDDAELAVAEGSTMVRIGTALFGPRPAKTPGPVS